MLTDGYTTKDIEYEWAQQSVVLRDAIYGSLPKFQIKGVVVDSLLSNTTTGRIKMSSSSNGRN